MSSTITIRLNDEEKKAFEKYAKMYKGGLSTMIKQLALEKLQDEYDLQIAIQFEKELEDGTVQIRPYEELADEVGLE